MEYTYQPTPEEIKNNKINLNRHERIGSTYGSGFMRTIAILFTIFVSLDFFINFMNFITYEYDVSVIVSSFYWMCIMVIRFLPNIVACIAIWMIFSRGHNAREVSVGGFRIMQIIFIFQAAISLISLIVGSIYIITSHEHIYAMEDLSQNGTMVLILSSFIIVHLVKVVFYTLLTLSLNSICKEGKGLRKFFLGYATSIICIVVGGLMILNLIPAYNIISESIRALPLMQSKAFNLFETILLNPLNIIFYGLFIGFGGLIGLLYCRKQNKIDKVINEE